MPPAIYRKGKPKLLVLASTFPRWKDDYEPNFVLRLCTELSGEYDITVITSRSPGAKSEEQFGPITIKRFSYAPAKLETLVYGGGILSNLKRHPLKWFLVPSFLLSMAINTRKLIKKTTPNVIHCHWIIPQGLVLSLLSAFMGLPPILLTSHGGDIYSLRGKLGTKLKRKAISTAAAMTVVSTPMKAIASQLGSPDTSTYVAPMGFGFNNKDASPNPGLRSSNQILFVGRLVKLKGLHHLIDVLPFLLETLPSLELVIVGDGPERRNLEKQCKMLGVSNSVKFMGALPQEELPKYYKHASLFCAPFVSSENGLTEGLGLVTIEAMSFGCPILIGKIPAANDIIPQKYREKYTTTPQNKDIFSKKIVEIMKHTNPEDIIELRKHVLLKFHWRNVKKKYLKILSSIAP
ncbi:glycosyltransferase family 4 protein [Marinobacter salinexigens]|uniref:Glycosyltransferase family 4 protein n=1 Tax=Marinobacter salinexigens TaxID=2919747 RepID=A0A5B0VJ48_9GAMM|nr:glycosyltransferase [Marinobacter salinexigens]KAA1174656.1 glycosyltransferase family 4 protein [Marinobacter salinexigens]